MTTQPKVIERVLNNSQTIAVVGLSSSPYRAGYYVPKYLQEQGYRIIPVNPELENSLGEPAYPDLYSVPEPIDLVLIFRRPEHVPEVVDAAIEIGANAVWMQLGIAHAQAAEKARTAGLEVVMNTCMLVEHRHRQK